MSYNFLYINPTTGAPIGWEPGTTIHYYVDPGPLGRLTNEQARTLIRAAMDIWENASPYADTPRFVYEGLLPEDVTGSNYSTYVSGHECYDSDLALCEAQTQRDLKTVIIFDEDDSILTSALCLSRGCSAIAGSGVFSGSASNPHNINTGYLVLGKVAGEISTPIYAVVGLMTHELGHLLGLAHTSINEQATIADTVGFGRYVPTMYTSTLSFSDLNPARSSSTLNPDDIAGITTLYPATSGATMLGTIKGILTKSNGTPMYHVNVVARNIEDPLCETYSFLSGRSCFFNTTCNIPGRDADAGYIISSIPSGTYTVEAEEVADSGIARTYAPPLFDEFIYGDAEFWNTDDAADEVNTLSSTLSVTAGETKENINITLNRNSVTSDRVKYISLDTFTPGPATRCPTSPPIDYASLIGISESTGALGF
ncbi:MAG: hypothetical protein IPJ69_06020 [Deltaproteobacteria bacterium]|nr:MAG: hypothetical protein IPJ69_06020 [Deltaproteobacteria bacterium]